MYLQGDPLRWVNRMGGETRSLKQTATDATLTGSVDATRVLPPILQGFALTLSGFEPNKDDGIPPRPN